MIEHLEKQKCAQGASPEQIAQLETLIGSPLAPEYREFLMQECNGVRLPREPVFPLEDSPDERGMVLHFYGVGREEPYAIEQAWATFHERFGDRLLPIGHDSFNSQVCLALKELPPGTVYLWDWAYQDPADPYVNLYYAADDFREFCAMLTEEEDDDDDET